MRRAFIITGTIFALYMYYITLTHVLPLHPKTCSELGTYDKALKAFPTNPQLDRNKDGIPCNNLK